ncbi:MAG: hypothetical protein ACRDHN_18165, partial [Thermomicrobiales bacterium]
MLEASVALREALSPLVSATRRVLEILLQALSLLSITGISLTRLQPLFTTTADTTMAWRVIWPGVAFRIKYQ